MPAVPHRAAPTVLELGDRRILLKGSLGVGSVAEVHRGLLYSDYGVRRQVACKIFQMVASEERDGFIATLGQIVSNASCIRHPNVVTTFELGASPDEQHVYIVSELVEGVSLARLNAHAAERGHRLPLDLALFIGTEIAEALNAARGSKGANGSLLATAHADLSPRDVLLSWHGEVKVSDFGIVRAQQASSSVRSIKKIARRADTMAPEVANGAEGDARSDVFSLGIMLRQMLAGPRFGKNVSDAKALEHARDGFVEPLTFEPHLPKDLKAIVDRALAIAPEDRFPHGGALGYELRRVALALGVGDARVFLKTTLLRQFADEHSDATSPHGVPRKAPSND